MDCWTNADSASWRTKTGHGSLRYQLFLLKVRRGIGFTNSNIAAVFIWRHFWRKVLRKRGEHTAATSRWMELCLCRCIGFAV